MGGVPGGLGLGPLTFSGAPGIWMAVGAGVIYRSLSSSASLTVTGGADVRFDRSHLVWTPSPVAEAQIITRVAVRRRLRLEGPIGIRRVRACFALLRVITPIG